MPFFGFSCLPHVLLLGDLSPSPTQGTWKVRTSYRTVTSHLHNSFRGTTHFPVRSNLRQLGHFTRVWRVKRMYRGCFGMHYVFLVRKIFRNTSWPGFGYLPERGRNGPFADFAIADVFSDHRHFIRCRWETTDPFRF